MMKSWAELKKDGQVALYFLQLSNQLIPSYLPLIIGSSFFYALTPFINIIMPRFIINELMGGQRMEQLLLFVGIIIFGNALLNSINRFGAVKVELAQFKLISRIELHLGHHLMKMDYEEIEDPQILDLKDRALAPINTQGALSKMITSMIKMIQSIIALSGLTAIIFSLNPLIIIIIMAVLLLNTVIFKKTQQAQFNFHQMLTPLNRQFAYYKSLASDFSMAKDVRLNNMSPYLLKKVDRYHQASLKHFGQLFATVGLFQGWSHLNLQLQLIFVYAYLVYRVLIKSILIGDFTMYLAATNSFSNHISTFLNSWIELRQMCKYLDSFRQLASIKPQKSTGKKKVNLISPATLEFKNVSFKYRGSAEYTLKNVSLKIKSGEKLSIVGPNGAGKTTFIKLLCRLYDPDQGEIMLNGINIKEFAYSEYIKLLAVVFQDYKLFSFSIKENIAFDQAGNNSDQAVRAALKKAGLLDKVQSLEKGLDTPIYKTFDQKGIEFSGGESQKMAIARAIFKDAPIVILDEPTAALDPYAEYQIYTKFNQLVGANTAIYISHRLSSCCFSDKIAVFEQGKLIEYGHHTELINNSKIYAAMWHTQAHYYTQ